MNALDLTDALAGKALTTDAPELDGLESLLTYFGIDYDPDLVQAKRLRMMQAFARELAAADLPWPAGEPRSADDAACLARAYAAVANGCDGPLPPRGAGCAGCQAAAADHCDSPAESLMARPNPRPGFGLTFDYGAAVRVRRNIFNDGSYPGLPRGRLLIERGSIGHVRNVGRFLQDQVIYAVHFLAEDRLVGCRESELQPATAPWIETAFEFRDRVQAARPLGIAGEVLVSAGEEGEITKVLREQPDGVAYQVQFQGRPLLQVPETALQKSASGRFKGSPPPDRL